MCAESSKFVYGGLTVGLSINISFCFRYSVTTILFSVIARLHFSSLVACMNMVLVILIDILML